MASDRTAFLIEMAAKLTGGDTSVATLAELGDRMLAAGSTARELDAAVERTSAALAEASSAARAAADAVAAGEQSYRAAEASAAAASLAVERMGVKIDAQRGKLQAALDAGDARGAARAEAKLAALAERQAEAAAKADAANAALARETSTLDALRGAAATAASQHQAVEEGLENVSAAAKTAADAEARAAGSGKVNEMAEALGRLGGPLGVAGQRALGMADGFRKLQGSVGAVAPYVALAVAIVAISTAALAGIAAIARWGVALADANRAQVLLAQGVAGSVAGGAALDATISRLANNVVPQSRDELLGMARDLAATGLKGQALSDALEKAAAKAAEAKFGPEWRKQMLSIEQQSSRLKANLQGTFGGLRIDGLLGGMSSLVALLDANTEAGAGLKVIFEGIFQPLIDGAAAAIPRVERLFLQAEILALKAYIALHQNSVAWLALKVVLAGVALAIGAVVIVAGLVVGALVGAAAMVVGPFVLAAAAAMALYQAGKFVIDMLYGVGAAIVGGVQAGIDWLHGISLTEIGAQMIAGLVNGLIGGASSVVQAMTSTVGSAIEAAKRTLGIASPSKVFAQIADYTLEGFVGRVEDGTGDAQGALEAMVAPPAAGAAPSIGGGGTNVGGVVVNITIDGAGGSAKSIAAEVRAELAAFFEGLSLQTGGGEVAA